MAVSIVEMLDKERAIDPDRLNALFTRRYFEDRSRGYGPAMHGVFERIRDGEPYREVIGGLFGGQGSYGNGTAMRVAPVGAYFADDIDRAIENARRSAWATHAHPEAEAGAVAVAVAAACACAWRLAQGEAEGELMRLVEPHLPESEVRRRLRRAIDLDDDASATLAASILGSGNLVSAFDTVPFCLWCASRHQDSFTEAMWLTVSGLGDRDTTCAIVGGVVALSVGEDGIPEEWLASREPLPQV
jgi:ADP-ribosylglycohydrolase